MPVPWHIGFDVGAGYAGHVGDPPFGNFDSLPCSRGIRNDTFNSMPVPIFTPSKKKDQILTEQKQETV